jgi:hypothetical protein
MISPTWSFHWSPLPENPLKPPRLSIVPSPRRLAKLSRAAFENEGLIMVAMSRYHPETRQWFQIGTRNLYTNRFDT